MNVDSPFESHRESLRLDALRRYRVLDTAPEERFDRITTLVSHLFRVPTALITLVDEHRQWFKSRVGLLVPETAREIAFCDSTIRGTGVTVVTDAATDLRFRDNPLVTSGIQLRFYAGAPLRTSDGFNIGTLAIIDYVPRTLEEWERNALAELARFVMSELELWRRVAAAQEEQRATVDAIVREGQVERELAERRFRALIENASDLTLLLDASGRVTHASRAAEQVLGLAPAELLGKDVSTFLAHDASREQLQKALEELGAREGARVRLELNATHRQGGMLHLSVLLHNLFGEPAVGALFVHARDVTSEVQQRAELERAKEQLRQGEKMEAIGRLAGGIAHDFNNMLTVILNYASIALRPGAAIQTAQSALGQIIAAGERASSLTKQILAFSRHQPTLTTLMDPNVLVRDVLGLLERVLGEHIQIEFTPGEQLPSIRVDRALIEQVLINLCTNARDAIRGEGQIAVRTTLVGGPQAGPEAQRGESSGFVMFSVRDTGAGMSPEVLERALEPFFTTKPVGAGTGLGLSMAYSVVRKHGGSMELDSVPGVGTEVRIRLPASDERPEPNQEHQALRQGSGHGVVLLAEDEDAVRHLAQRGLEEAGYDVYVARDGLEALELMRHHPDEVRMAVLDAVMPRMGGLEALQQMHTFSPGLPYLIVSGYTVDRQGMTEGHWLPKPYRLEELVQRVLDALGD